MALDDLCLHKKRARNRELSVFFNTAERLWAQELIETVEVKKDTFLPTSKVFQHG